MANFGIKVSAPEKDVLTSADADLLLNITDPLTKLDVSNDVSFRNITLTFVNNPPEPSGIFPDIYATTLVYSFNHGYDYVPATWFLIQVVLPVSGSIFYQSYFQDGGLVDSNSAFDEALFYVQVTATAVNFYIRKYYNSGAGGSPNDITGLVLKIRSYVFVEDIGN
jgi:hypothetical protein